MAAPTFITSYSTSYSTTTTPKTVSVTTQAGDVVVVYGGSEDSGITLGTPSGNSISFTLQRSVVVASFATAYVWTGVDATGGTNWTLSTSGAGGGQWGTTCLVFRNSNGIGASSVTNVNNGAPSLGLTTTGNNSAVVVFNSDWDAQDGTTRTWRTVNSITPTAGNNLERDYTFSSGAYTSYGAYYNDVGAAGAITVGLSAPGAQIYSIVSVEVLGIPSPKTKTIVDSFAGTVIDTAKWTPTIGAGGVSQNNVLTMPLPSNDTTYTYLDSVNYYDLTNSYLTIENTGFVSTNQGSEQQLMVRLDGNNMIVILFDGNQLGMNYVLGGVGSSSYIARDTAQHRWWRIREQTGTLYWETSPDASTWTALRTAATPFNVTNITVSIRCGTWQNVASPGTAVFDNLNTIGGAGTAWFRA